MHEQEFPQILVRYLPQFHPIPENDLWWEEGFTDWCSVKKGKPLYEGHNQPRIPLNDNYYNLLDKNIMIWQAEVAKKYGISGFSFYHYWFKDGKMVLEKPAENLLKWQEIDMPFCFTWANETWARTWSNIKQKNSWADDFENKCDQFGNGILLEQSYGDKNEWKKHLDYLLPFFKDSRYLKKDNKPVFIIYLSDGIPCLVDMIEYWNALLKKEGFSGIYLIAEILNSYTTVDNIYNARMVRFPNNALRKVTPRILQNGVRLYNYDDCWKIALEENYDFRNNKKTYLCGVIDFDTTPRKGCNGEVLHGGDIEKFNKYFDMFILKNLHMQNEYVFLNAWNEWGEGMYLEPDELNGYKYLEIIKNVVDKYRQIGNEGISRAYSDNVNYVYKELEWLRKQMFEREKDTRILSAWLSLSKNNIVAKRLLEKGYKKIAIYGLGMMGQHLIDSLKCTDIDIEYVLDRNAEQIKNEYPVYKIKSDLPEVDIIIVTLPGQYREIKLFIAQYVIYPTMSLEELILS